MSKHSPAPWTFSAVSEQVIAADGETVVWEAGTNEADNYLIAAAPELLSALERMENALSLALRGESLRDATESLHEARAALAKAKGEQP